MDQAKAAVKDFMSKSGHHDTTVHEKVAPAVVHETVNRHHHEDVQTAIDKEVHQDHYHTSVQPILDKEVLPEKHHHNIAAVEHRQFEHGNERDVAARLEAEAAKFRDERVMGETRQTTAQAPVVAGEHIHHHVHETIQPVVNKQTIEPHVTHTTVPIHEVHHNAAQHHSTSALPAVSLSEFKKQGGVLTGREERYDGFEGEPRSVGGALASETAGLTSAGHGTHHDSTHTGGLGSTGAGVGSTGLGSDTSRTGGMGSSVGGTSSTSTSNTTGTHHKASLMDKLDPRKDSDGDGKKGFMK
ncbi:hypothetical protein LTR28_005744 [Elasticomyces elasticus]|nr:hypothetical protein LTR28_005744 [Elasticomyces elasticus]